MDIHILFECVNLLFTGGEIDLKCPDCNAVNRSFVEYCVKCGANLYKLKHKKNIA